MWTTPLLENDICFLLGLGGEHAARHLGGRLNTSHGEHGRSDIGKTAVRAQQQIAADESDIEMEYIRTAIENTMMDDYSLYVYLSDENAE